MEKEKLIIRNFGPIKNVELDLGRFNILIGEQATGKSTVAKVLAVCRYFSYIANDKEVRELPFNEPFKDGLTAWGLEEYITPDTYIFYSCLDYCLEVKFELKTEEEKINEVEFVQKKYLDYFLNLIPFSLKFKNLLTELKKINDINISFDGSIPTSFFLNDVKNVMDNPFYLPTQRGLQSIFSIGRNSIQNLSDALFNQLAKMDGIARHFTNETYIEPLDIFYKNVQGRGYIRKAKEENYYSLFNAASGYQSEIPIVLVIKYYNDLKKRNKTFLVEEPEQNLFPAAQEKLMEYLVHQTMSYGNSMLLTTQSPYIQTSLNNMIYAYHVGQIHAEETAKIVDKRYWINADDVSAYMMRTDGSCEDIFDREEGLIKVEMIDGISSELNIAFDELLNIEFKKDELNIE